MIHSFLIVQEGVIAVGFNLLIDLKKLRNQLCIDSMSLVCILDELSKDILQDFSQLLEFVVEREDLIQIEGYLYCCFRICLLRHLLYLFLLIYFSNKFYPSNFVLRGFEGHIPGMWNYGFLTLSSLAQGTDILVLGLGRLYSTWILGR